MENPVFLEEFPGPLNPELLLLRDELGARKIPFITEDGRLHPAVRRAFSITIFVGANDLEKARGILDELRSLNSARPFSFCPECDSEKIVERESVGLFSIMESKKWHCLNCGYEWKS
jgi:uncharacterized protein with PIN domain